MIKKAFSVIKLISLKLRFGKRLEIKSIKQFIRCDTEITIGKKAFISFDKISANANVHFECTHGKMSIGHNVSFNRNCIISCKQKIFIGDNCYFGPNVCIFDYDHAYNFNGVIPTEFKCSDVIIDDGCWLGTGVIVLRGTHIGKNSVIGAGTVVKGNIPPNSLVTSSRETNIVPSRYMIF